MKKDSLSKVISLLAGLSLALNSVMPSGAIALAYQEECSEANLIINGSFEDPIVSTNANWDIFGPVDFISGWQADWRLDVPTVWNDFQRPGAQIELQKGVNGWLAQDGDQWTELDTDWDGPSGSLNGEPASIHLWQDITTVSGDQYEIKFWTSPRPGLNSVDNNTEAKFGSTVLDTITEDGTADTNTVWTEHIYTVAAAGAVTRLMFTDLGTSNSLGGFIDDVAVSRICEEEQEDPCEFGDRTGWYGEYFNYFRAHQDMNLDSNLWPDKTHGDPMSSSNPWTADWYTQQYFRFWQIDANLNFGDNFFPFDPPKDEEIDNGHEYHFGAHWTSEVTAPVDGEYPFTLRSDDDAWLYLDGALITDNSGIHPPTTINGTLSLTTTPKIVDIYFAERHIVQSHMSFSFTGDVQPHVVPYNRNCVQPIPELSLEKTGAYDPATGQIDYTIHGSLIGSGTLYDATITDELPAGTTWISGGVPNMDGTVVTWTLGNRTAPASGTFHLVVSVDSYDPWADAAVSYNPGLQKGGGALPSDRTDTSKALGVDTDTDNAPINFVSLGFGGDIVLGFDNYILDGAGNDIHVIETSYGNPSASSYPEEVEVLASQNGFTWTSLGTQIRSETNHDNNFDLNGLLPWAKYLKLVDKTNSTFTGFPDAADGYDVAGVQALHSAPAECSIYNLANGGGTAYDGQPLTISADTTLILNQEACEKDVTIIAHKIVCDLETDLPNWGNGGPNIGTDTAQNWVDSHKSCRFVPDWNFQWGPQNAYDPGDTLIGPANEPWQTLPPTDATGMTTLTLTPEDVGGSSHLWFREELQNGYIPFTHDQNNNSNIDNVSAEMYCHVDVLNYDNYDRIDGIELGKTYNCVGFNVPSRAPAHTVSGMKFNDKNGDGTKDEGENGLGKWIIYASKFVQTIQVEAQNDIPASPEFWTDELDSGKEYILRVSGTYDANDYITADAKYSMRSVNGPDWTDIVKNYESYGPTLLDLFIDDVAPNWGVFNPGHVYWQTITGTGTQVKLQIYEIYAQNDSGALTVDIYEVIDKQITDDEGNYHFTFPEDIGEVMISEQTQDGWLETLPSPEGYYIVYTDSNYTDKDFGNHYTIQQSEENIPGSVTGMKFNDHDGNGIQDENDGGLEGWTIHAGQLINTLEVDSHYLDPELPALVNSSVLENGQEYFLRVSQTFLAGDSITADAKYSIRTGPDWTDIVENYGGWEPGLLELWMNSALVNWGTFNSSHVYWYTVTGNGNPLYFHIKDIWPINNSGKLKVEVFKVIAETTTNGIGEYTLDIPDEISGDVTVAEETQEGWIQTYPMPLGYYTVSADGLTEDIDFGNYDTITQDEGNDGNDQNGGDEENNDEGEVTGQGDTNGTGPALEPPSGSTGGGDGTIPPVATTNPSEEGEGVVGGGEVAGETEDNTGSSGTNNGGGRQIALSTGDQGDVQDQGDVAGDQIVNDENNDNECGSCNVWRTLGIGSLSLLLLLLILYTIYRLTRKRNMGNH